VILPDVNVLVYATFLLCVICGKISTAFYRFNPFRIGGNLMILPGVAKATPG
jgi:hypothetical protein